MDEYVGKICPYCKTEIKEGDEVKVCPECGIPHHAGCWEENHGCTTFGCKEQHYEEQHTNPTDVCANCGAPLGDGQDFCPKCGAPKNVLPKNVCGKCGAELQEGQAFCPKCGQKVGLAVDDGVSSAINQFNANVQKSNTKKKKLPIIIGIVAVIAAAALYFFLKGPSVESIALSKSSVELKVDASTSVTYTILPEKASDVEVSWNSSNESIAVVSNSGKITGKGDGSCTVTVTAGGKSDSLIVTVKSGPDFKSIYKKYCNSIWASCGSDGSYLNIDTNPYDWDDNGLAYPDAYTALIAINDVLGLPSSLLNDMGETTGADGKQSETFEEQGVTVSWKYHPDRGLEVTYKAN